MDDATADLPPAEDADSLGLTRQTVRSLVVEQLRQEILSGELRHGTHLRQSEIEKRLKVSSSPVREAFRELATLGLVDIRAHRGATVVQPTDSDLSNIYQIRAILEPISTAWSAQRIGPADLEAAEQLVEAMRTTADYAEATSLNRRFHRLVARTNGNTHLADAVINLLDLSTPYIGRVMRAEVSRVDDQTHEHEAIMGALRSADPEAAYMASLEHLSVFHQAGNVDAAAAPFGDAWLPRDLSILLGSYHLPSKHGAEKRA
jgi:DNA-binding GntR family transcriptional regulator